MSLKSRFPGASLIPSLDPEIFFLLRDEFYYGPDFPKDKADFENLVETLDPPDVPRAHASRVRTFEITGHEPALAAYYQQIIRFARQHSIPSYAYTHYFKLSLGLCNTEHDVDISFLWYDSFGEIDAFLAEVARIDCGPVWDDEHQGWAIEVHAMDGFVYIRDWEPDSGENRFEVIVPRDGLVAKADTVRAQARQIIAQLSDRLGTDFWTSYAHEQALLRHVRPKWRFW